MQLLIFVRQFQDAMPISGTDVKIAFFDPKQLLFSFGVTVTSLSFSRIKIRHKTLMNDTVDENHQFLLKYS